MRINHCVLVLISVLLIACREEASTAPDPLPPPPPPSPSLAATIAVVAGDQQTARKGSAVPIAPVFQVRDQRGQPLRGATVRIAVSGGGGSVGTTSATSDSAGNVTVSDWVLGQGAGTNTLSATLSDAGSVSTTVVATARNPRWTILVYLAADNNLAPFGVADLDEIERAGSDPEVQIVIQGEFSADPKYSPCPSCAAPNTFRYPVSSTGDTVVGPDLPVEVIGNRDMTQSGTLRDFVTWGRMQYPAERYALVLWNHGNGYKGLIEDRTNAGQVEMTLANLRQALVGLPPLDLLDFDMCLMGSADLLEMMRGTAGVISFSQDVEPGPGNPYEAIIKDIQAAPTSSTRSIATRWVDAFHNSYAGNRSQTTKSAFDMSQYDAFSRAWEDVANSLASSMAANRVIIGLASQRSQKFILPQLKDVGNWTDSMLVRTTHPELRSRLSALKSAATSPGFRIISRTRNGTDPSSAWVRRATGLSVLLPSGAEFDALPSTGPGSFEAYRETLPDHPWTRMLAQYLVGAPVRGYRDLAPHQYETYLVWDTVAASRGVDVDLWVLEPDGNLYVPWIGKISPNGSMTGDSHDNDGYFEGYAMNRFVQAGRYKFYAHLYADSNQVGTRVDLVYRTNPALPFTSLYAVPGYPSITKSLPISRTPTPSFSEIENGKYSDVRYMAYWEVAPSGSTLLAPLSPGALDATPEDSELRAPEVTPEQVKTVLQYVVKRKAAGPRKLAPPGSGLELRPR